MKSNHQPSWTHTPRIVDIVYIIFLIAAFPFQHHTLRAIVVNCPTRQSFLLFIGSLDWFSYPDNIEKIKYSYVLLFRPFTLLSLTLCMSSEYTILFWLLGSSGVKNIAHDGLWEVTSLTLLTLLKPLPTLKYTAWWNSIHMGQFLQGGKLYVDDFPFF